MQAGWNACEVGRRGAALGVLVTLVAFCLCDIAIALPPPLAKVPESGKPGEGAGRMVSVEGIAADPSLPGNVYVVDRLNARIDEFSPWGEFIKAWGWGVNSASPNNEELQTCTAKTGCRAGTGGGGAGQFFAPVSLGVDGAGDVYVVEPGNHRVQKFDPSAGPNEDEARFLLTFGFKVNQTKEAGTEAEANLCTAASGDVCQAGSAGSGPGRVGGSEYVRRMAVCPAGNEVFLGEGKEVQVFEGSGGFKEVIAGLPANIRALASDGACDLYAAFQGENEVLKLKGAGPTADILEPKFLTEKPFALGVDGDGSLYVAEESFGEEPERAQEYDASAKCLTCGGQGEGGQPGFDRASDSRLLSVAATKACEANDVYITHFATSPQPAAFFRVFGDPPNPLLCPPPKVPPSIDGQYALGAEATAVTIQAKINPHYWSGTVGTTTYYVQYATEACFESGGWEAACVKEQPAPPGSVLKAGVINEDVTSAAVQIEGLTPATTYRYRFAAKGSGAPGKVVFGVGGTPDVPGKDSVFRTFALPQIPECPSNQAFRTGPSTLLPDCRAYEMVSPTDKEGGDIVALLETTTFLPAVLNQSAASGDRLAYGSARSFGGAESAPFATQYVAARKAGKSWVTHPVSPPHGKGIIHPLLNLDTEFRAFSGDLCQAWFQTFSELPNNLEPLTPPGVSDLLRRSDEECGGPAYQALNTVAPPNVHGETFHVELQGLSSDESTAVFLADDELAPGGSPGIETPEGGNLGPTQLYGSHDGIERFLCVLPGGGSLPGDCTAGGNTGRVSAGRNREADVAGALSADGSRVYWTAPLAGSFGGPGPIYLRENPFSEEAECSGVGSPCTIPVSKAAEEEAGTTTKGSQFWAAAKDGSTVLFTTGGRLYEFRPADESTHLIVGEVLGLMGQSADASRIYLASKEEKGAVNVEGKSAVKGNANLYFYDAGQFHFIGALEGEDLTSVLSPIAAMPQGHTARVATDGLHAAFMSTASMTGYDNTDASSGQADAEVFVYDAAAGGGKGALHCASCNPSGARPRGRLSKEGPGAIRAAAKIPVPENILYASRVLSDNGTRLYFESYDALTPGDTNGQKDIYQWEAPGIGGCTESTPSYSPFNGGCVDPISSGGSVRESSFIDADPTGHDVFFATLSSLLPQDPGLVDIYDARQDGGLPTPPPPTPPCDPVACQHPSPAPPKRTLAGENYEGPEGLESATKKPTAKCPKGKHRIKKNGKNRCVAKKKAKNSRKATGRYLR